MDATAPGYVSSLPVALPGLSRAATDAHAVLIEAYRLHGEGLLRRLRMLTRDPSIAEDLCQEALTRLYLQIRAGRAPQDAGAWLHQVARNLVVSRARRVKVADRVVAGLRPPDAVTSTEDAVLGHERLDVLRRGLAALPCEDRRLLLLAADGLTGEQIAGHLGISEPAARTRLHRARRRLRDQMARIEEPMPLQPARSVLPRFVTSALPPDADGRTIRPWAASFGASPVQSPSGVSAS